MDYTNSLSISDFVRKEKVRIEKEEALLKDERAHLDWLLKRPENEGNIKTPSFLQTELMGVENDLVGLTVHKSIEKILEESEPKSLQSKEILEQLRIRGNRRRMTLGNLHAHMSKLSHNDESPVIRTEVGYYSVK